MADNNSTDQHRPAHAVAGALLRQLPGLTEALVDQIMGQLDSYRSESLVTREDLYQSCLANLEFMFRHVAHEQSIDLEAPRQTGILRAQQGVPLSLVQNAFRVSFQYLWEVIVHEATVSEAATASDLVSMASDVWLFHDLFSTTMMNAYAETMEGIVVRREHERSAMVEALLQGHSDEATSVWEVAHILDLPYEGVFVVVAAGVQQLRRTALPEIETVLRNADIGSAWRLTPDLHIGIVSVRQADNLAELIGILEAQATSRVGVSPIYSRLDQTPHALRFARIAMADTASPSAGVIQFDQAPLPMMVLSAPLVAQRLSRNVLGSLLDLPPDDRDSLLLTLTASFMTDSSANAMADHLRVHPNTVRYRVRRIEQLTGRSLQHPQEAAELYMAVQAWQRLPRSLEDPLA